MQYLLPSVAELVRQGRTDIVYAGVHWGQMACGAAAMQLRQRDEGALREAELLSLFIDPHIRRRGAGMALLRFVLSQARRSRSELFSATYSVEPAELRALDSLFRRAHMTPALRLPVYLIDSARYHDAPVTRHAFSEAYRRPDHIVLLSRLTQAQRTQLYSDPAIPSCVHPANGIGLRPDLSLAYLRDGRTEGFWLCASTSHPHYSVQGVWRSDDAPATCFQEMYLAHINLCYRHAGGDFSYYVSPKADPAERLIQAYTRGDYIRMEQHAVEMRLA